MSCGDPARTRRGRGESGFTLVELVVTTSVVLVGVVATIGVFLGSLDATAGADNRVRAAALAAREVEGMQAIPYDSLGLDPGASGYRSEFEGATTVAVSPASVTPLPADEVLDNVAFSIRRDIVWADTGGYTDAFKRVIAAVTWSDDSGSHEVRADGGVYPGGLGPYGGSTTTTSTTTPITPGAPTGLVATASPENPTSQIDLTWTANAPAGATWEIEHSPINGLDDVTQDTASHPWNSTEFSVTGLAAQTEYRFHIRALAADGTPGAWSSWVYATTDAAGPDCTILAATATPASVKKKVNNKLDEAVLLSLSTSGDCSGLQAVVTTQPGTSYTIVLTQYDATFLRYIGKNTSYDWNTWSTGNKSISVREFDGTEVATISLQVTN